MSAGVDRILVLAGLALLAAALVTGGRVMARRRLHRLTRARREDLWSALGTMSDGRPTIVSFSTPGCATCRTAQRPALAALQERAHNRVRIIHVDAAGQPDIARVFGVMTVPCTVILDETGAVLTANQGFATTERLASQVGLP